MKRILFISENLWLSDSADTNCILHLIDGLTNAGYKIDVFSHTYLRDSKTVNNKNFNVHFFPEKEQMFVDDHLCKDKNFFLNLISKILVFFITKIGIHNQKRNHLKKYKELNREEKIDFIISVYCPSLSNEIARYIYKKTQRKVFLYFLDPHTFNYQYDNIPGEFDFETRSKDEKKWSKCAKGIIYSRGVFEENLRNDFNPYNKLPCISITLPNFIIEKEKFQKTENQKITLLYTGKFYKNIRNPDGLINVLKMLNNDKYSVEFYGECCEYLKKHYDDLPESVRLRGSVSTDECKKILKSADVLINVGNTTPNQVPSKVFEYISTGKPILNIVNSENDISLHYLEKYPKIFNIKVNESIDFSLLEKFLVDTSPITNQELDTIYKEFLIDSIVEKITEFIENCD